MSETAPEISIVIPVFNEVTNLQQLHDRIVATLEPTGRSFEIVTVDDGSSDGSLARLQEIHASDKRLRIVRLSRNFGQTPALYAGFAHVRGQLVVALDADLQNPPEEIPKILQALDDGYDMVIGWRELRQDSLLRRIPSRILNATVSKLIGAKIKDLGCGLKGYRREIIKHLTQLTHHSRYVPAEMLWLGASLAQVKVEHDKRAGGNSKYDLAKLLRLNFDMIAGISSAPMKIIGWVGWLFSFVGFGMGARILFLRVYNPEFDPTAHSFATVTALFFILSGVQLIATGLMCEYVGRIFVEVQNKPYYIVKDVIE
jgi:undecaprenyl-phosphate 4-deoxy-4-formamido-L-arabinose transferase